MASGPAAILIELETLERERLADPARGLNRIRTLRSDGSEDVDVAGRLIFLSGLFLKQLLRQEEAEAELRRAISWSASNGLGDTEARSRANLAVLLADMGNAEESAAEMQAAWENAPLSAQGLVAYLDALLQQRRGNHHQALRRYEEAHELLEKVDDQATLAALRLNRAIGFIYLDRIDDARAELAIAETSASDLGMEVLAALVAQNLGFAEARRGYLADGLAAFDRAEQRFNRLSWRPKQAVVMQSDKAEVLLQAGLAEDAREAVDRAVRELEADGILSELSEARLLLARICLALGDPGEARRVALQAAWEFHRAKRPAWVEQAFYVARQADYVAVGHGRGGSGRLSARLEHLAGRLLDQGWPVEGRDALVLGALAALETEDGRRAATLLLRAGRVRADGPMQHRARFYLARAELLRQSGQVEKAAAMVRRGVRQTLDGVDRTGSPEARVEGLSFAGQLTGFGTKLALESGRPVAALRAVELQRSVAQALMPATEPVVDTAEPVDGAEEPPAIGRADSESQLRQRSLRLRASGQPTLSTLSWSRFRHAAANRTFVYYLEERDRLWAVVVRRESTKLVDVASTSEVDDGIAFLGLAVQRLGSVGAANQRAVAALDREVVNLRRSLIEPLSLDPGQVVVIPSPSLQGAPWGLMAADGNEISLAASGASWLDAATVDREPHTRVALISGPGLEASEAEVTQIKTLYPDADLLVGADSTVDNVLGCLDEADLVHIAAHGRFRADSPMFSQLELHDGPLTVHDLQKTQQLPDLVVLPACETGAAKLYPSGGTLGTASALLSLGARTVVAPVHPIGDREACDYMVAFHKHLVTEVGPATALHRALRDAFESEDWDRVAVAAMFSTYGVG